MITRKGDYLSWNNNQLFKLYNNLHVTQYYNTHLLTDKGDVYKLKDNNDYDLIININHIKDNKYRQMAETDKLSKLKKLPKIRDIDHLCVISVDGNIYKLGDLSMIPSKDIVQVSVKHALDKNGDVFEIYSNCLIKVKNLENIIKIFDNNGILYALDNKHNLHVKDYYRNVVITYKLFEI